MDRQNALGGLGLFPAEYWIMEVHDWWRGIVQTDQQSTTRYGDSSSWKYADWGRGMCIYKLHIFPLQDHQTP